MSKKLEFGNPMLVGAMELVKKNNTPANRKVFADELLHAFLLVPVVVTPEPEMDEKGRVKLTPESKMNMFMLPGPEEKKYFVVFTDMEEMKAFKPKGHITILPVRFKELAAMVAKTEEGCDGIMINPFSVGMVVNKISMNVINNMKGKPEEPQETRQEAAKEESQKTSEE